MTTTSTKTGDPLHFPGSLILDATSVIAPPAPDELARIAEEVAADGLMLFTKRLVDGARKRRFDARWRLVNRSRLELARLCIERALVEQF